MSPETHWPRRRTIYTAAGAAVVFLWQDDLTEPVSLQILPSTLIITQSNIAQSVLLLPPRMFGGEGEVIG